MRISLKTWMKYKDRLARINKKAAADMERYVRSIGGYKDHVQEVIDYAFALSTKYGEAAAAAACEMYDAIAVASGASVPPAEPASTAKYTEVAIAVQGTAKNASETQIPGTVSRLVKQAGADTTLQNAKRDGAYFAWVPSGDTCAYCLALAGLGWRPAGKLTLNGGHAEHIHANCDCTYAIDLKGDLTIEGYQPSKYNEMVLDMTDEEYDAEDIIRMSGHNAKGHYHEGLNKIRRNIYKKNKEHINEQKRDAYQKRKERESSAAEEINVK